jgi:putative ABC transport system permease protein
MFQHYIKIAIRSLMKFKGYSIINLTGLALGLSAGVLIMVYALDELSYDKFHTKSDRLYRVVSVFNSDQGQGGKNETNAWPIGDILRRTFPEAEAVLYTRSAGNLMVTYEGKKVREVAHYASPEFFQLFSFALVKGNPETALTAPYSLVISERMEAKYFPGENAMGKTLVFNDTMQFHVTGVMKDIPSNSHIQADMLPSLASWEKMNPDFSYNDGWGNFNMRNYILLKPGTNAEAFFKKAEDLYNQHAGDLMKQWGIKASVGFEPFNEIYLKSNAGNGMGPLGSLTTVYLLSGVGLFVIVLACINFINLATARSVYRAKEVGVKKVVGSTRSRLVGQFLSESMVITVLSFVIALAAIGLFLPMFNQLLAKSYTMAALFDVKIIAGTFLLLAFITLCAGYYPAWVMSAFKPAEILKGKMQSGAKGVQLRRVLVVAQFMISVSLVAGTIIVINQLQYMQSRELGFTKDEVFVVNIARTKPVDENAYNGFLNELKSQAVVKEVTFCNALPAVSGWRGQWAYPEGKEDGDHLVETQYIAADDKYLSTLDLKLLAGRNFDLARKSDEDALIINEETVRKMGWETPENAIGKRIVSPSQHPAGVVIGVIKDYHDQGLQNKIAPVAIDLNNEYAYLYAIRFSVGDTKNLIEALGSVWGKYFPENEFNYFFLSDTFAMQYAKEQRLAKVFSIFSVITIMIAVFGLFGLVSFLVTAKTKEIGVRKILGASVWNLTSLLSMEFILLVVAANVVAVPLVVYFAQEWLQSFAYRMELSPMVFVLTTVVALLVTVLTVSIQTVKAATANPVQSLRSE